MKNWYKVKKFKLAHRQRRSLGGKSGNEFFGKHFDDLRIDLDTGIIILVQKNIKINNTTQNVVLALPAGDMCEISLDIDDFDFGEAPNTKEKECVKCTTPFYASHHSQLYCDSCKNTRKQKCERETE